ncbi:MAG: hypothetical protein ABJN95_06795 [Maribacter sp.]|uniref:hypothetical protein n=1 Tax=Maribacter sp. TaxID=1897614 RepID=UPI003299C66C
MGRLKDSVFYHDAIHEINYSFGDFYLFDGFVIAEVYEGVTFTWDNHGKKVVEDIAYLYDTNGHDLIFISNRINSYSIKPTDWRKFFKNRYVLNGYAVVSYSTIGNSIALLEKLFIKTQSKRFNSLEDAIEWAKGVSSNRMVS